MKQDDPQRGYASPACSLHEHADMLTETDVEGWRRRERERLVAIRQSIDAAARLELDAAISVGLDRLLSNPADRCIAVYWPIRGEPDLRLWYDSLSERGAALALPVVEGRERPLVFHSWRPGDALKQGALKIPVPKREHIAEPDVILSPLVGFDESRHRLGNGGGYYDRTLAALRRRPLTIGVGYSRCAIRSIYPQPFDVPMDVIVTESMIDPPLA